MNKKTTIWSVAVVVVLAIIVGIYFSSRPSASGNVGAVALGNNYIERYTSPLLYNGGYNSQLPIKTSSNIFGASPLDVGTTTTDSTKGDIIADGAGTTTLQLSSSGPGGTCINMETNTGTVVAAYIVGTSWVIQAGTCK